MTLQRVIVYNLSCDEPGCDEWSGDWVPRADVARKADEVREVAHGNGWTRRGGKDYCPEHSR